MENSSTGVLVGKINGFNLSFISAEMKDFRKPTVN
jgi:hypothetical protein